jgi:hypothetical protein
MTEDEARPRCREPGATLSIRQRREKWYVYVSRWLPRATAEVTGHQTGLQELVHPSFPVSGVAPRSAAPGIAVV